LDETGLAALDETGLAALDETGLAALERRQTRRGTMPRAEANVGDPL
jgi:hypothetical protein